MAIAAFIVPYILAFNPVMILEGDVTVITVSVVVITSLVGLFGVSAGLNGHLFKKIPMALRFAIIAAGVCMMVPETVTDIVGLMVICVIIGIQFIMGKKQKTAQA